jgi:hypothetical protein
MLVALSACIGVHQQIWCQMNQDIMEQIVQERVVTGDTLKNVKVSLADGLTIAEKEGKPISAKFEFSDGALQLSIYVAKDSKFFEVIVDHNTGKVTKVDPISEGDNLKAAISQAKAMERAKDTLQHAVQQATKDTGCSRAISVAPSIMHEHPIARVTLVIDSMVLEVPVKLE